MSDETLSTGAFLVMCLVIGYSLVVVIREIVTGLVAAKKQYKAPDDSSSDRFDSEQADNERRSGTQNGDRWDEARNGKARAWHDVLGVEHTATMADVQSAYRRKISMYHPDRVAGLGPELMALAEVHAKEINAAYQTARTIRNTPRSDA